MSDPFFGAALLACGLVTAIASAAALLFFATEALERRIDTPPPSKTKARQSEQR